MRKYPKDVRLHGSFERVLCIVWACGGIGIRVRLRSVSRKGWEFESPHAHRVQKESPQVHKYSVSQSGRFLFVAKRPLTQAKQLNREDAWSQIIFSSSFENFCDPDSLRFLLKPHSLRLSNPLKKRRFESYRFGTPFTTKSTSFF